MASNDNTANIQGQAQTQPKQSEQQPGLVAGHAEYVKGAAEATIGSVIGSHAWKGSGEQDKAHAVASMRVAAADGRDPAAQGFGRAEEVAGRVVGCEGMRAEGEASKGGKRD